MGGPGYTPFEMDDGSVLQSGVYCAGDEGEGHDNTFGYITRAVVLKTYYTDDPSWDVNRGVAADSVKCLACDVRAYGRAGTRPLYRVPVCQNVAGIFDEDSYTPRGAAQHIDGGALVTFTDSDSGTAPTPAELMDGDHVLVAFLENDPFQPVVLPFCLPHPARKNPPVSDDGRRRRIRFNGTLIEFDKEGNITVDASEAAKDELGPNASEVSNLTAGGKVTLTTKTTGGDTMTVQLDPSGKVVIDAPLVEVSDSPTESVVKGDTFSQSLLTVLGALADPGAQTTAVANFTKDVSTWLSTKVKTG